MGWAGSSAVPRRIAVTRVAVWCGRDLIRRARDLFLSAAHANGADQSGLARFTYAVMLNYAVDAAMAVALANTLFFSAATGQSKNQVGLYLLITLAPFAVIAPVVGPVLDRVRHGRRLALSASFLLRTLLAVVMASNFDNWLLYPAALGCLVLSKSFDVLKATMTPRVLPTEITLTTANSRLTAFGIAAGAVFGAVASGCVVLLGSPGALWYMAVLALIGARLCMRIPRSVDNAEGAVLLLKHSRAPARPRAVARHPMARRVVVALWGNCSLRLLTGFLTLFVAFVIKDRTPQAPYTQLLLLGLVGAAAGIGSFLGNAVGARTRFGQPVRVIVGCLSGALASVAFAALVPATPAAALVAGVAASASSLAKVCLDAVVQREMPEASRASAFGRSESVLQLSWVFGGALGVLLPADYRMGFTVITVLLALGLLRTRLVGHRQGLGTRRRAPGSHAVGSRMCAED